MKDNFYALLAASIIFFIAIMYFPFGVSKSVPIAENTPDACLSYDFSGNFYEDTAMAIYSGEKISVPKISQTSDYPYVLGANNSNKWIEVDLSEQKLVARDGDSVFLETPVSTGLPGTPTPTGEFWIWIKLRATRMEGGVGRNYYNLPNVPYVMYFSNSDTPGYKGYGLHGAYWHNSFGTRRSHGCVNLPIPAAEKIYYWATPNIPQGKSSVKTTNDNPGTKIVIHE